MHCKEKEALLCAYHISQLTNKVCVSFLGTFDQSPKFLVSIVKRLVQNIVVN